MIHVLCFGDSNTWGFDPRTKRRYAREVRWPGVLQCALGPEYHVIEEGLNGRTTVWPDPLAPYRDGKAMLTPLLETHKPLDWVVVMLGTNDFKHKFAATAWDIGKGAALLVDTILGSRTGPGDEAPRVLLIAPPPIATLTELAETFEGGPEKSLRLARHYAAVAKELGCAFLDAGTVIRSSDVDGIHLEPEAHAALGRAVAEALQAGA